MFITVNINSRRAPQRHCPKDLNFEIVDLVFGDAGIAIDLFVTLAGRGRGDFIDLLDSIDVADTLKGCIFKYDLFRLNVFTEMAGHAFLGDLSLGGDFYNQQVLCRFAHTKPTKCLTDLSTLAQLPSSMT